MPRVSAFCMLSSRLAGQPSLLYGGQLRVDAMDGQAARSPLAEAAANRGATVCMLIGLWVAMWAEASIALK